MNAEQREPLDLSERGGRGDDGQTTRLDRRLFMQFMAFGECFDTADVARTLSASSLPGVLYADALDPRGIGLLTWAEDPGYFVTRLRAVLAESPFSDLWPRQDYTMFGRTYAVGYERDLEHTLLAKPIEAVVDETSPWAVWYPLRRAGAFSMLEVDAQRRILGEHGAIGRRFAEAGLARDVRLACHGLDRDDHDFVIGLIGRELHALSALVQTMRSTVQTSQYLEKMGPFFVGHAIWRSAGGAVEGTRP